MRIAIITGASSGLGREFVLLADRKGYDQIWAIARRRDRLEELARECTTTVRPIPLDLRERTSIDQLETLLQQEREQDEDFSIGFLVNAAGLAKFGTCRDLSRDEVDMMVDVNCRAAVDITELAIRYMGKGSRIIEVASCASFQPLQGLNVYAASKAFLLSYTRALRWELVGSGIHATALCPPWMKTEFVAVARDTENGATVRHPFPMIGPKRAAVWSTFVNRMDLPVATCSIFTLVHRICAKFLPNPIVMAFWEGIRRI